MKKASWWYGVALFALLSGGVWRLDRAVLDSARNAQSAAAHALALNVEGLLAECAQAVGSVAPPGSDAPPPFEHLYYYRITDEGRLQAPESLSVEEAATFRGASIAPVERGSRIVRSIQDEMSRHWILVAPHGGASGIAAIWEAGAFLKLVWERTVNASSVPLDGIDFILTVGEGSMLSRAGPDVAAAPPGPRTSVGVRAGSEIVWQIQVFDTPRFWNVSRLRSLYLLAGVGFAILLLGYARHESRRRALLHQEVEATSIDLAHTRIESEKRLEMLGQVEGYLDALFRNIINLSVVLDSSRINQLIFEEMKNLLPMDAFVIAEYEESGGLRRAFAMDRIDGEFQEARIDPQRVYRGRYIQEVIQNRRTVRILRDASYRPADPSNHFGDTNRPSMSLMYAPMIARERLVGVISVQSYEEQAYQEKHEEAFADIARLSAVTIDNAHLYESSRRSLQSNRSLHAAAADIASDLNLEVVLRRICDAACQLVDVGGLYIAVPEPGNHETVPVLFLSDIDANGERQYDYDRDGIVLGDNLATEVMQTRQKRVIHRTADAVEEISALQPRDLQMIGEQSRASATLVYLPLTVEPGIGGLMSVQSYNFDAYDELDLQLLETLASYVSVAIRNARLYEKLQELSQMKSEFLANISHELRTPMNAVIGFAELLEANERKAFNEEEIDSLRRITRNAKHLMRLIGDLLDFSRADSGQLQLNKSDFVLQELMKGCLAVAERERGEKPVALRAELPDEAIEIHTDRTRVRQILYNLLSNAVKFTSQGEVVLSVRRSDEDVRITVRDSGIGIAENDIPRIFEAFYQIDGSRTRTFGGTGLGLSISKEIVERLGGRIDVESTPGQGSAFEVRLPLV